MAKALKIERKYVKNAEHNAYAEMTYNDKGTEYICVTVGNAYQFYFTRTGKTLIEVDDVHLGSWDVYQGKDVNEWKEKKIYKNDVVPTLKMFLKKYPAKK